MEQDTYNQIAEVETWMNQVQDDLQDTKDYDFVEDAVTEGNTLGNVGSYLAVYEEDGELYVDDELLEQLDSKKTEMAKEESTQPAQIQERTNHREAIYGDIDGKQREKVRNGETTLEELWKEGETESPMLDGNFGLDDEYEQGTGHKFLKEMISEFRDNTSPPKEGGVKTDTISPKPKKPIRPNGGEKIMTDYEELQNELDAVYDSLESLEEGVDSLARDKVDSELETLTDEIEDARDYVSAIEAELAGAQSDINQMEETIKKDDEILEILGTTLDSINDTVSNYSDQLDEYVETEVYESLSSAVSTLQGIGGSSGYEGPSQEVRTIMDDRLDEEAFEDFQEAAEQFE